MGVGWPRALFHSSSIQALVMPTVDKLAFLGRSLLWDAPLFKAKLGRGKIISREK